MPARRRLGLVQGVEPDRVVTESLSGLGLAAATLAGGLQHGNRNRDRGEGPPREKRALHQIKSGHRHWNGYVERTAVQWIFEAGAGRLSLPGERCAIQGGAGTSPGCGKSHCLGS